MGGYKLNISMDDDEENKDKLKDKEKDNEDDNDENSIKGKDKIINKNDISSHYETKNISEKTKTELWLKHPNKKCKNKKISNEIYICDEPDNYDINKDLILL